MLAMPMVLTLREPEAGEQPLGGSQSPRLAGASRAQTLPHQLQEN